MELSTRLYPSRVYSHVFHEKSHDRNYFGWYSWLPSVVWNKELGLYIMVTGGTYAGRGMTSSDKDCFDKWMHTRTGSPGFWYSVMSYGPWRQFHCTEYWTVDHPENLTYQPKLSPKWVNEDRRQRVLIWPDAMKDKLGINRDILAASIIGGSRCGSRYGRSRATRWTDSSAGQCSQFPLFP